LDGLRELGNIEGRDFDIIIQPARSTSELPKAAEQLVQLNPDVILAAASPTALAAKQATSTIPIVVAELSLRQWRSVPDPTSRSLRIPASSARTFLWDSEDTPVGDRPPMFQVPKQRVQHRRPPTDTR
jgi:hypothetical protein